MNILFVIDSLRPGGAQRQLVELIKGLDKSRYKVGVVVNRTADTAYHDILWSMGVSLFHIERKGRYDLSPIFKIARLIKQNRADVVQPFLVLGSLYGVLAAKLTGRPVVCCAIRTCKDATRMEKYLVRMLSWWSDYFVSNSFAGFKNRFCEMRRNFRVIRNGMDFSRFRIDKIAQEQIYNELRLNRWRYKIGMVASMSPKKDHKTLLYAARILLDRYPDIAFVIVGEDVSGRKEILSDLAVHLGISDNVIFTGYRPDVEQLIQLLDIAVLLTDKLYQEGMPNAVIEAMALGKPVIATKGGGTDEVIQDGNNGLLINPESPEELVDAICKLREDGELATSLARNGRLFAREQFGMERYVQEYEEIYRELSDER